MPLIASDAFVSDLVESSSCRPSVGKLAAAPVLGRDADCGSPCISRAGTAEASALDAGTGSDWSGTGRDSAVEIQPPDTSIETAVIPINNKRM